MGSKQTLLILLPSTNNTRDLWLLAKDSSAVLSPLSSLTTSYFAAQHYQGHSSCLDLLYSSSGKAGQLSSTKLTNITCVER